MDVRHYAPDPRLAQVVQRYQGRSADLAADHRRIALPARTEVLLEFYFETPHLVELQRSGERERAPWAVAVGPQTHRRVDLILSGRVEVFTVHFEPTGLHRLFGVAMPDFTDAAISAEHLLGLNEARDLHARLAEASGLPARAAVMDQALLPRLAGDAVDPITQAVRRMRRGHGGEPVERVAQAADLSPRHFGRLFKAQVGMAPKTYARVLRLNAALAAKAAEPQASWTDLAHRFGWFDSAHLDKDFHALAGAAPTTFTQPPRGKAAFQRAASDPY